MSVEMLLVGLRKRVLIAWELGGNYGHLSRCLVIAEALRQRGHEVIFAVRDTRGAVGLLSRHQCPFVQAPVPARQARQKQPPANYSEMLLGQGYRDELCLKGRVVAWAELIRLCRADALLADHAPTALIAAQVSGLPAISIGNGFAIPLRPHPQPSIRPWEDISEQRLLDADRKVDEVIARTLNGFGKPAVGLADLFGDRSLLDTFPELDHFGERANGNYIGPIVSSPDGRKLAWQHTGSARVFAYLRPEVSGFSSLIGALQKTDAEVIAVIPGLPEGDARKLATRRLRISLVPLDIAALLPRTDLLVSYGGTGTVAQTLLAGVPQLIAAGYVEQHIAALRVEAMGAGLVIGEDRRPEIVGDALGTMLSDTRYKNAAEKFSKKYAGFQVATAVTKAVLAVESLGRPLSK